MGLESKQTATRPRLLCFRAEGLPKKMTNTIHATLAFLSEELS